MRNGLVILTMGLTCAPAMAQEMESDERSVWVADVNPTTLDADLAPSNCRCPRLADDLKVCVGAIERA